MTEKSKGTSAASSDLSNKVANSASKRSLFERQKAEAEAKRLRAEQETAAVYEDFVKSFDHEDENDELLAAVGHGAGGRGSARLGRGNTSAGSGGAGKRHFSARGGRISGPGSLGPGSQGPSLGMRNSGPGSLGPVPSAPGGYRGQKRPFNDYARDGNTDRDRTNRMFSYSDQNRPLSAEAPNLDTVSAFAAHRREDHENPSEEKAAPKPTLHLSSLPPGVSPAFVRSLIPTISLTVQHVRILPPSRTSQSSTERKSTSAIITLPTDTPAIDIDTVVSQLQNKYLGFGCYLSISRHLSSAALRVGGVTAPSSISTSLPFGARPIPQKPSLLNRGAPPPGLGGHRAGFAPPTSYISSTPYSQRGKREQSTQIIVTPPSDLKQLKLIHLTLEALLTHGPEFEALLMTRREVQRDEKWAWLWDARSKGGVYYRWRLWAIYTGVDLQHGQGGRAARFIFERSAPWVPPETGLRFEYTTKMEDLIEDEAYDSSDEEDYDDDARIQRRRRADQLAEGMSVGVGPQALADTDGMGYLNPLAKAKLVHLLARLPDSNTKLRRGDVARVTAFAIEHAGEGADEIAAIITANVRRPMCFTDANPDRPQQQEQSAPPIQAHDGSEPPSGAPVAEPAAAATSTKHDTTPASLVTLYLISDVLMSSTTSGVRHAWRYRALFESALASQRIFACLGRMDRQLGWGRLKAEKWKRSVQTLLSMWEGWCVFPQTRHEDFVRDFVNPPGSGVKEDGAGGKNAGGGNRTGASGGGGGGGKWKSVADKDVRMKDNDDDDVDGMPMAANEDQDLDGDPMSDADMLDNEIDGIDGTSMLDSSDDDIDDSAKEATHQTDRSRRASSPSLPAKHGQGRIDDVDDKQGYAADGDDKDFTDNQRSLMSSPGPGAAGAAAAAAAAKEDKTQPPPKRQQRPKAVDMFADDSD